MPPISGAVPSPTAAALPAAAGASPARSGGSQRLSPTATISTSAAILLISTRSGCHAGASGGSSSVWVLMGAPSLWAGSRERRSHGRGDARGPRRRAGSAGKHFIAELNNPFFHYHISV